MKKGDIIKFGNYYKSPIEWLVLDVKGNEVLLISRYGLDCKQYHYGGIYISWEDCDLRKWLNNDFIKSAFSEEDAKKIKVSELKNEDNPKFGTRGGNDTRDRIFCLSIAEAKKYFRKDNDRQCQPTANTYSFARRYNRMTTNLFDWWYSDINSCFCYWWLRSPGNNRKYATYVDSNGWFNLYGHSIHSAFHVVRPALRIIFDETLKQRYRREEEERRQREEQERQERRQREEQERKQREEQERRQREEQERRQKELLAQAHEEFSAIIKKGIRKGMIIPFGSYLQNENGCKVPIEWLVLDVKENEALLISRYGLDCKQYHHNYTDITWEDCDLRKWLNNDFIKLAFSEEDAKKIKLSKLKNEGTRGGNETKDRVFCLSIDEAEQYFISEYDRQCKPTAYARNQGVYVFNDCCFWWLRSAGIGKSFAMIVDTNGLLFSRGNRVDYVRSVIRPALRIICNL